MKFRIIPFQVILTLRKKIETNDLILPPSTINKIIVRLSVDFTKVDNMAISPPRKMGEYYFCLMGDLQWRTLVEGGGYLGGECCFSVLAGGLIWGLIVYIHLKENLPEANINYLSWHHFKDKLRQLLYTW